MDHKARIRLLGLGAAGKTTILDTLKREVVTTIPTVAFNIETITKWHLQPSVATKNEGLDEGFRWLTNTIQSKTVHTEPIMETINDSKRVQNGLLYDLKTLLNKSI